MTREADRDFRFGFRVVGPCTEARRLVDWADAFRAHASCDGRAELSKECYLSGFQFGADFRAYLEAHLSTKGYAGACWASCLWFDIDREDDADAALTDARKLAVTLTDGMGVGENELLAFYSGRKGFHLGLPSALWTPPPGVMFHRITRRFCEQLAGGAGVGIDTGVYDRVRCFRAPNSRHPKTGRHKRHLSFDELMHLSMDGIIELASGPSVFETPEPIDRNEQLAGLWDAASADVKREAEAADARRASIASGATTATLNRVTLETIREAPLKGDRHRLFYSAAANLREMGAPPALVHALLDESGRDSGLPPSELRRTIDNGIDATHAGGVR